MPSPAPNTRYSGWFAMRSYPRPVPGSRLDSRSDAAPRKSVRYSSVTKPETIAPNTMIAERGRFSSASPMSNSTLPNAARETDSSAR